jgi:hypothetical protein
MICKQLLHAQDPESAKKKVKLSVFLRFQDLLTKKLLI